MRPLFLRVVGPRGHGYTGVMKRLVGERRALAAAVLAFYGFLYVLNSLMAPDEWRPAFTGLAGAYALGFFSVVAGYFWARWYAIGLGLSGVIVSAVSMWQIGPEPVLVFYGLTHLAISLLLWGDAVASAFDGQLAWRERFHLDENATHRLGRAVIRASVSLPFMLLYALAPRQDQSMTALATLALAGAGTWAILRMRTWGILALAGAAGLAVSASTGTEVAMLSSGVGINLPACAAIAGLMLVASLAPFAGPVGRWLRQA
jgi:hypothetical protein